MSQARWLVLVRFPGDRSLKATIGHGNKGSGLSLLTSGRRDLEANRLHEVPCVQ